MSANVCRETSLRGSWRQSACIGLPLFFWSAFFAPPFKPPIRNPPPKELGFRGRPRARDVSSLSCRSFRPGTVPANPTPHTSQHPHHTTLPPPPPPRPPP